MHKFVVVCGFYLILDNFLNTIFIKDTKNHVIGYNLIFDVYCKDGVYRSDPLM